jgi:hypothetical protein
MERYKNDEFNQHQQSRWHGFLEAYAGNRKLLLIQMFLVVVNLCGVGIQSIEFKYQ